MLRHMRYEERLACEWRSLDHSREVRTGSALLQWNSEVPFKGVLVIISYAVPLAK